LLEHVKYTKCIGVIGQLLKKDSIFAIDVDNGSLGVLGFNAGIAFVAFWGAIVFFKISAKGAIYIY